MNQALRIAHSRAWNLAITLLVPIVVFETDDREFGAMPSAEYDGEPGTIIHEFDAFQS